MSIYACNPEKNVKCRKGGCWIYGGECCRTSDEACAIVLDGKPVEFGWRPRCRSPWLVNANGEWFTREEIESGVTPVAGWIEERDKNGLALMDTYQAVKVDGAWRVDGDISWSVPVERYVTVSLPWSTYGKRWRLWKDKPSDFHRWEEPWEVDH
jgi:hypothetical protein